LAASGIASYAALTARYPAGDDAAGGRPWLVPTGWGTPRSSRAMSDWRGAGRGCKGLDARGRRGDHDVGYLFPDV